MRTSKSLWRASIFLHLTLWIVFDLLSSFVLFWPFFVPLSSFLLLIFPPHLSPHLSHTWIWLIGPALLPEFHTCTASPALPFPSFRCFPTFPANNPLPCFLVLFHSFLLPVFSLPHSMNSVQFILFFCSSCFVLICTLHSWLLFFFWAIISFHSSSLFVWSLPAPVSAFGSCFCMRDSYGLKNS